MSETSVESPVKVQWSNEIKGLFAACTKEGAVKLYSYHDAMNQGLVKAAKKPEALPSGWLKRFAGVSLGYAGKTVSFSSGEGQTKLVISQTAGCEEFINAARTFDSQLEQTPLPNLCSIKVEENSGNEHEKSEWLFMKASAAGKKEYILKALGFDINT